jgi:hypothetical protein
VDYKIRLETTRPNFGGLRWWFMCPLVRRDGGPPRRAAKLYLPSLTSRVDPLLTLRSQQLPPFRALRKMYNLIEGAEHL